MTSFDRFFRDADGAVSKPVTMRLAILSVLLLCAVAAQAQASDPGRKSPVATSVAASTVGDPALSFPRIQGAGGVLAVDASAVMPSASAMHRLFVDISEDATAPGGINRRLGFRVANYGKTNVNRNHPS